MLKWVLVQCLLLVCVQVERKQLDVSTLDWLQQERSLSDSERQLSVQYWFSGTSGEIRAEADPALGLGSALLWPHGKQDERTAHTDCVWRVWLRLRAHHLRCVPGAFAEEMLATFSFFFCQGFLPDSDSERKCTERRTELLVALKQQKLSCQERFLVWPWRKGLRCCGCFQGEAALFEAGTSSIACSWAECKSSTTCRLWLPFDFKSGSGWENAPLLHKDSTMFVVALFDIFHCVEHLSSREVSARNGLCSDGWRFCSTKSRKSESKIELVNADQNDCGLTLILGETVGTRHLLIWLTHEWKITVLQKSAR